MKQLRYFIYGIVFYIMAIPIIESIAEIITTFLELEKGKASIPVLKINKEINTLQTELLKTDEGVCIGFQAPSEEEYYDDDEFDDKLKHKKK